MRDFSQIGHNLMGFFNVATSQGSSFIVLGFFQLFTDMLYIATVEGWQHIIIFLTMLNRR